MTVLDIVLLVLLGFGLIKGFMNGLFVEVASLVALVAGVYGAIHFSSFVASFLESRVDWEEKTINIAAFAITFMIIGSDKGAFTAHAILGYSATLTIIINLVLIWRNFFMYGFDSKIKKPVLLFSKIAYIYWLIAYLTGSLMVIWIKM